LHYYTIASTFNPRLNKNPLFADHSSIWKTFHHLPEIKFSDPSEKAERLKNTISPWNMSFGGVLGWPVDPLSVTQVMFKGFMRPLGLDVRGGDLRTSSKRDV